MTKASLHQLSCGAIAVAGLCAKVQLGRYRVIELVHHLTQVKARVQITSHRQHEGDGAHVPFESLGNVNVLYFDRDMGLLLSQRCLVYLG